MCTSIPLATGLFLAQAAPTASLGLLDVILFFVLVIGVIAFGIWQGNKGEDGAGHGGTAGYSVLGLDLGDIS